MADTFTISTQKPVNAAFDYGELRKTGIRYIEQTASAFWTDYNTHDPGITTLELLCYALTDLAYRTTYSIPDLLATAEDTSENIKRHFFSAKQILPVKAVTIPDYRKLLIDIEGVKNAWLTKRSLPAFADLINKKLSVLQPVTRKWENVNVKGYYDILLEFDTEVAEGNKGAIKEEAKKVLMANRNLSEDFLNVAEVTQQQFRLCSEIEIKHGVDPSDLLANIFFNIQLYLTPLIKFYSLKNLFDAGIPSDEIFQGPLLAHGFIKEEELLNAELKTAIHLSDIMSEILKEEAVINILDIVFNTGGPVTAQDKWVIRIDEGKQPLLNILGSNVLFYTDGIPFRPRPEVVAEKFKKLMSAYINTNDSVSTEDITYETGTYKNTGSYHSLQNDYPKNYGISHWGLPADVTNERKIQAKQLQAYLFFFDQQLANYLSQLAHLRNLFSTEKETQTYFTQIANTFKDAGDIFVHYNKGQADPFAASSDQIQGAAESPASDAYYERRNIFLDHLLSRFAESFFDYVSTLNRVFPPGSEQAIAGASPSGPEQVIDAKINFLKNYPEYSSGRFSAFNYTDTTNLWDTANTSGLEKRLERLLGLKNVQRHDLVNVYSTIQQATNAVNITEYWFEIMDNRTGDILLKAADKFPSAETAKNKLDTALGLAETTGNYSVIKDEALQTFTYGLKKGTGEIVATGSKGYASAEETLTSVAALVVLLSGNQCEEGMFLVEHLLLFPETQAPASPPAPPMSPVEAPADGLMPICADDNCDDCETRDPYSFRISIILPAYARRFLKIDFRRYCERVIRMETPSHIYPKICWVNNEDLKKFEVAYKEWLQVKAGVKEDPGKNILQKFIDILTTVKTVYPPARLEDCSSDEQRTLFLLNQNSLGTLKT